MLRCRGNLNYNKITVENYLQNGIILPMQQVHGSVHAMCVHMQHGAAGNAIWDPQFPVAALACMRTWNPWGTSFCWKCLPFSFPPASPIWKVVLAEKHPLQPQFMGTSCLDGSCWCSVMGSCWWFKKWHLLAGRRVVLLRHLESLTSRRTWGTPRL